MVSPISFSKQSKPSPVEGSRQPLPTLRREDPLSQPVVVSGIRHMGRLSPDVHGQEEQSSRSSDPHQVVTELLQLLDVLEDRDAQDHVEVTRDLMERDGVLGIDQRHWDCSTVLDDVPQWRARSSHVDDPSLLILAVLMDRREGHGILPATMLPLSGQVVTIDSQ